MNDTSARHIHLEATEKIKQECPAVKVLALTAQRATAYLNQPLKAGASGYVLKQVAFRELVEAISTVASGGNYVRQRATPLGSLRADGQLSHGAFISPASTPPPMPRCLP